MSERWLTDKADGRARILERLMSYRSFTAWWYFRIKWDLFGPMGKCKFTASKPLKIMLDGEEVDFSE